MMSIALGPIALPVAPLLLLLAIWVASWTATRSWMQQARRAGLPELADAAGPAVIGAAGIGLLASRLAHLASNAGPYFASPLSMLDLRDGGWHPAAGWMAGAAWLLWRGWQTPLGRRPLVIATVAGLLAWAVGTLLTVNHDAKNMPNTALTTLDGRQTLDLRTAAAGRPVVVNLWATWCGPCRQEMPVLAAAQQREPSIGFLFVNQGESEAAIRTYLGSLGQPLREVLLDPDRRLGPAVGSQGLPTTLFYDATGSLIDAHFGVLNAAALEGRLQALRTHR